MQFVTPRNVIVVLLLLINAMVWTHATLFFQNNKDDIYIAFADIVQEFVLPYRLALLSVREPVDMLPLPVYGVTMDDVSDTWGAAREEGREHEGTDIFAERGTPVFSSTEGYVVRTNIGTRGGRNVMVYGPGGIYYYYAHLNRIAAGVERGMKVTGDTVLGFVGNSGNATGTPPHLHFGIYPEQWDGQNPYPMLIDRW